MQMLQWSAFIAWLLSGCAAINLNASTAQVVASDLTALLSSGARTVFTNQDASYLTDFTQRWTVYKQALPQYLLATQPKTVEDVRIIVKYAAANQLPFLATGGGHGYSTTLSRLRDGLNVDMSHFRQVHINQSANLMTVGGATTFSQVYKPLYAARKQFPTGGSSSPGLVGVALGGGIGPLYGLNGMAIDALCSVQIVTGSGEIIQASATQNSELFWGLRGAGFNFGIVTSASFTVYDAVNGGQVLNADMVFPASVNRTIFSIFKRLQDTQDPRLALSIASSLRNNVPTLGISAIFFGPTQEGVKIIKPFLNLRPTTSALTQVPSWNLTYTANFGADVFARMKGVQADLWGYQLNNLDIDTLGQTYDDFMRFVTEIGSVGLNSLWLLEKFSRFKTQSVPDNATAYPWRNAIAYGFFEFNLQNDTSPAVRNQIDQFAGSLRKRLVSGCGNAQGNVYVNYARGDESPAQMYGVSRLDRLRRLKARYDPFDLFSHYNSFGGPVP